MIKQFLSFLRKEFKHIYRDSRTMLILLIMPVVMIYLFGFAITTEVKNSRVVMVDQAKDEFTEEILQAIDANAYFTVVEDKDDNNNLPDLLQNGKADVIIVINQEHDIQLLTDGSEPNMAQSRAGYLQSILQNQQSSSGAENFAIESRMLYNPQLKSEYNFVPGVIGMLILLICAMMTSLSIVKEKEMGTMEVLLASPLHPLTIIVAKLIPYFVVSCINLLTILLLCKFVLDIPVMGSVTLFFVISMVYILVSLLLGLLISIAVSSQLAAMFISLLLIIPTMYLSGWTFPIESMSVPLQHVSSLVPARWYMDAARKIMIQGAESRYVMKDFGILCLDCVVLTVISLKLFKTRLE